MIKDQRGDAILNSVQRLKICDRQEDQLLSIVGVGNWEQTKIKWGR